LLNQARLEQLRADRLEGLVADEGLDLLDVITRLSARSCDGVAAEPATGAALVISAAATYSSEVAIDPGLRDGQPLLLGRDRRPRVAFMRAKTAEEMTNASANAPATPSAWRPAARGRYGARSYLSPARWVGRAAATPPIQPGKRECATRRREGLILRRSAG
jgi:hypothetical protein